MTLNDIINFINHSGNVNIIKKEGGYRISIYVSQMVKWDSPHIVIDIVDYDMPSVELSAKVEFRKEDVFVTEVPEEVKTIKKTVNDRYNHLLEKNDEMIKKDFSKVLKDVMKC